MQVTHTNHRNLPLTLLPSVQKNMIRDCSNTAIPKFLQPFIYFANIPLIALIVKGIRLTWHIIAFIISAISSVTNIFATKRPKEAQTKVVVMEQATPVSTYELLPDKELKDNFLVMASHELKTPMTTILGQAQLLLRRLSKTAELPSDLRTIRAALESIDGQTRRLNALVDDLLDLHNIRAGRVQLHMEPCDLVGMCREVVKEQHVLTGRMIELEVPEESIMLQADANRLYQVMVNLVDNAVKYSPEGSPVKVLVDQHRDIGVIEVSDSGPGILRDQQTRIFEPFYRTFDVQSTSKSGLGLGLTICKDIVERHHGRIWCRSRVGKGSTFIVELPLNRN